MLFNTVALLATAALAWAGDSSSKNRLKVSQDKHDPRLFDISTPSFTFSHDFLTNEEALKNAPPETATNPRTPGTITRRRRRATDYNKNIKIKWKSQSSSVVKFDITNPAGIIGAEISFDQEQLFYGVWEYPFDQTVNNKNVTYDVKGLYGLKHPGTDWASGRTPYFFTRSGLGFYMDTNKIGRYNFNEEEQSVTFAFNTTKLTYYVFYDPEPVKVLEKYAKLSNTAELPPESGFGPIFWNNDWNTHWPEGVTNAEENYYDVVDHLYYNQIRSTAMFADREFLNPFPRANRPCPLT